MTLDVFVYIDAIIAKNIDFTCQDVGKNQTVASWVLKQFQFELINLDWNTLKLSVVTEKRFVSIVSRELICGAFLSPSQA